MAAAGFFKLLFREFSKAPFPFPFRIE